MTLHRASEVPEKMRPGRAGVRGSAALRSSSMRDLWRSRAGLVLASCLLGSSASLGCQLASPGKVPVLLSPTPPLAPLEIAPDGPPVFVPQRAQLWYTPPVWSGDQRFVVLLHQPRRVTLVDMLTGFVRGAWDVCAREAVFTADGSRVDYLACEHNKAGRISLETERIQFEPASAVAGIEAAVRRARVVAPLSTGERQSSADGRVRGELVSGKIVLSREGGSVIARANPCTMAGVRRWLLSPKGTHVLVHCAPEGDYRPTGGETLLLGDDLQEQYRFSDRIAPIEGLQFTPDGRRAAVVGAGYQLTVIDIESEQLFSSESPSRHRGNAHWSPLLDRALCLRGSSDRLYQSVHDAAAADLLHIGIGRESEPDERRPDESPFRPSFDPPSSRPIDGPVVTFESGFEEQGHPASNLIVTQRGESVARILAGNPLYGYLKGSPDGQLIAYPVWRAGIDRQSCPTQSLRSCAGLAVVDVAAKRRLFSLPVPGTWESHDGFSGDGALVLMGRSVYESRTGELVHAVDAPASLGQADPGLTAPLQKVRWLGPAPRLLLEQEDRLSVVDPRTGRVGPSIEGVCKLVDVASDGAFVLVDTHAGQGLFDTTTGALRLLPNPQGGQRAVRLRGSGFVLHEAERSAMFVTQISVLRLSDGRWLRWEGELLVTDEGVFDGEPDAWREGAFRLGSDVLRSRMVPLREMAPRFHRRGLEQAFFAGEDVSPVPERGAASPNKVAR